MIFMSVPLGYRGVVMYLSDFFYKYTEPDDLIVFLVVMFWLVFVMAVCFAVAIQGKVQR